MKAAALLSSLILLLGAVAGCTTLTGRTAGEIIDDSAIVTVINAKIIEDPALHYLKINVSSNQGNVLLTGFVASRSDEQRLIGIAGKVRGVKSVKSMLKLEGTK